MTEPPPIPFPFSDDELALRSRQDPAHFGELYRRYLPRVYRYCRFRVATSAEAEDVTHQVFLDVLQALPRYRPQGHFAAWLFAIARRRCADHHRAGLPELDLLETLPAPVPAQTAEERERLNALLRALSGAELELLRLRYAADLEFPQIARLLGRTTGAVKMAHHRLLEKLRASWEDDHAE